MTHCVLAGQVGPLVNNNRDQRQAGQHIPCVSLLIIHWTSTRPLVLSPFYFPLTWGCCAWWKRALAFALGTLFPKVHYVNSIESTEYLVLNNMRHTHAFEQTHMYIFFELVEQEQFFSSTSHLLEQKWSCRNTRLWCLLCFALLYLCEQRLRRPRCALQTSSS